MIDALGTVIETRTLPKNASTTISFGYKVAGNYELDLVPTDNALTYSITASAAQPLALKDGADMPDAGTPLYFYGRPKPTPASYSVTSISLRPSTSTIQAGAQSRRGTSPTRCTRSTRTASLAFRRRRSPRRPCVHTSSTCPTSFRSIPTGR